MRIPQQEKIRFVPESAKLQFLFHLLCCFGFHGQIAKTLHCSKLLQKQAILRKPQQNVRNPEQVCGIHEQIIIYVFVNLCCRGIRNCKWNPQIVSGIRINLRNPLTFAESAFVCRIQSNNLYSLVAESAPKSRFRKNLRYRYLYAESTEFL